MITRPMHFRSFFFLEFRSVDELIQLLRQAFSDKGHYQFTEAMDAWDLQALLAVMTKFWREAFARTLG
ncbi:MAG: hypothetical protein ACLFTU_02345 [Puniceicoccaceae bacterium]